MANLAKIKKERQKNDIRIGFRIGRSGRRGIDESSTAGSPLCLAL
jgi:hypothetical protein